MNGAEKAGAAILWVAGITALAYGAVSLAFWISRQVLGRAASSDLLEFVFFVVAGGALLISTRLADGQIRLPLAIGRLRLDHVTLAFTVATLAFQAVESLVFFAGLFGPVVEPGAGAREMRILGGVNAVIMAPLVEEAMFRGLLYTRVERAAGATWALVASALCFAAFHGEHGIGYVLAMIPAGFFLGYARMKSGSIALPILIHAWMNLSIGLMIILLI